MNGYKILVTSVYQQEIGWKNFGARYREHASRFQNLKFDSFKREIFKNILSYFLRLFSLKRVLNLIQLSESSEMKILRRTNSQCIL